MNLIKFKNYMNVKLIRQSDLTACDNEPIHTPGSIQPFGVLLALDVHTLTVRHVSRSCVEVFGPGAADPLGSTASEIAEERSADLEPFLGLHYPASDIPAQARALFLVNHIRVIPDAASEPIPVVPDRCGSTGLPLDLSRCLLRSAAPVHREYLHNMGVRGSLTASLVIEGRLWGLIACHHPLRPGCHVTPRRPGPAEREACDPLAQLDSAHVAFLAEAEDREYLLRLTGALSRTGARVGATSPPIAALAKHAGDLLDLVGAGGAVVRASPVHLHSPTASWHRETRPESNLSIWNRHEYNTCD